MELIVSRYLLITSCATMGGIAIWCMHYIGNRAIVVGDGDLESQIIYNPGVTAASFFVPILALIVPFRNCGISEHVSKLRIFVSGTLTGLAICGMHYLGQAGIANYTSVYHPAYVVGSAVIAVVASVTALGIFFILRATWTNSWWKRLLCAALLAGGVSGMHWLGTIGTEYRSKEGSPLPNGLSSGAAVIVVLVLVRSPLVSRPSAVLNQYSRCPVVYYSSSSPLSRVLRVFEMPRRLSKWFWHARHSMVTGDSW